MTDPLSPIEVPIKPRDATPAHHLFDDSTNIRSVALTGLFIIAVLYTLHIGRVVFLPIAVALIFSVLLAPILRGLKQVKVPEPVAAVMLLSSVIVGLGYGVSLLAEPAAEWVGKAPEAFREAEYKLRVIKKPMQELNKASELIATATNLDEVKKVQKVEVKGDAWPIKVFSVTGEFLAGAATMLILLFFLLSSGDLFLQKLVKVLPRLQDKKRAVEIVREIESNLSRYLFTVTCINAGLGVAVGIAMHLLGMPNPVLWGVMSAVLTFVPYLGHMVGAAVVTLVAAATFDEVGWMFLVGGTYWGLAVIEGTFVTPMILGHRLELNPVVLIVGLTVWGWIWGIGGALLAVPLLVAFKIFCDHVEPLSPVGDFIGK